MLRLLALQDENTFRQIVKHPERVRMPKEQTAGVTLSVLDPTQGIILDSAPARLTPDIASRSGQPCAPVTSCTSEVHALHLQVMAGIVPGQPKAWQDVS